MDPESEVAPLTLFQGERVFTPTDLGRRDVLVAGERILAVEKYLAPPSSWSLVKRIDAHGFLLLPGLVDSHAHPLGGGGDGGPLVRGTFEE